MLIQAYSAHRVIRYRADPSGFRIAGRIGPALRPIQHRVNVVTLRNYLLSIRRVAHVPPAILPAAVGSFGHQSILATLNDPSAFLTATHANW